MAHLNIDRLLADIDACVPPESLDVIQEVSGILQPQFELILALSSVVEVTQQPGKDYIDTHHLWFNRSIYTTKLQRQFRSSFVVPINRGVHDQLHAELPPPPMPNRVTMLGYLTLMDKKETQKARDGNH